MYDWAVTKNRAWESQADGMRARSDSAEGYSVGVVVTLPVFDGFLRENALNTAKARLDRAVQTEGLARQQVAKEVNQAALMLAAAEKSVQASQKGSSRRRRSSGSSRSASTAGAVSSSRSSTLRSR